MSRSHYQAELPLLVQLGRRVRSRTGLVPFGPEHMSILRSDGVGHPPGTAFERWLTIAADSFWRVTLGELPRGSFGIDDRMEAFQWSCERLWSRWRRGAFASAATSSERGLFLQTFRRLVRDWRRSSLGRRARELQLPLPSDDCASVEPAGESQDDVRERVRAALKLELTRAVVESWRVWPTQPMRRLVLACTVCPSEVTLADVAETMRETRTLTVRLRSPQEAWALLEPWLARQAAGEEPNDAGLAFALRGPEGMERLDHWAARDRGAAVAWLWKQRQRAQDDLGDRLGFIEEV